MAMQTTGNKKSNDAMNVSIIVNVKDTKFFIICERGTDFANFVKMVLCKINRDVLKGNQVYDDEIDLKDFNRLVFSVVHQDGSEIPIENDIDFRTAIVHFDGKLDVNIKLAPDRRRTEQSGLRFNYQM